MKRISLKSFSFKNFWNSNRWLQLLAVLIAILCWVVAAMTTNSNIRRTIHDVPVDMSVHSKTLTALGLNALDATNILVDVVVEGPRTVVGKLDVEDVATTVRITSVNERGSYDLPLTAINSTASQDFEIIGYDPATVSVRFDTLATQTFTLLPMVQGISVPKGYILDTEYVSPETIEITGPQAELDKIAECVVMVELTETLDRTHAEEQPVVLLDVQGNEIDTKAKYLTLSATEAQVVVPVLKETGLPLEIRFLALPTNFPVDELEYTMSSDYVEVAGPVTQVEKYTEIVLGYIDLKTLTDESAAFYFPVELPTDQFISLDGVTGVSVRFNTDNWESAAFSVSNIQLINVPPNYDVEQLSQTLSNITFYGDADVLASMSSDDIVAEADLSEKELSEGQINYPVKISVPSKGLVWAIGDHSILIQVTEK